MNPTLILRVSSAVQLTLIKRGQRSRIAGALDEEFGQVNWSRLSFMVVLLFHKDQQLSALLDSQFHM